MRRNLHTNAQAVKAPGPVGQGAVHAERTCGMPAGCGAGLEEAGVALEEGGGAVVWRSRSRWSSPSCQGTAQPLRGSVWRREQSTRACEAGLPSWCWLCIG
jgi:hypothetical protein